MDVKYSWIFAYVILSCLVVASLGESGEEAKRNLPIFNIVNFPNDVCTSDSSRNGTCYTSSECSNKGGSSSGTCANGFGVCCVFSLSCGDSSSDNNTYIVQSSFTTDVDSPCTYSICKFTSNVCRIRFDFTSNELADPPSIATTAIGTANNNPVGSALGHCVSDSMSISSGGSSSPVICGYNTGQHMIVDAIENCVEVKFTISSLTTTTRKWDIYVSQYECGMEYMGGPPGCLQYFTGSTGAVASFGFPSSNTITATVQHLANQHYTSCIRRESGKCYICYIPIGAGTSITDQGTYGLGVTSIANTVNGGVNTACDADYIYFPGGAASPGTVTTTVANKFCGRYFASVVATAHATVCTRATPFFIGVNFDETEVTTGIATNMGTTMEANGTPSGTIGFKLVYSQGNC